MLTSLGLSQSEREVIATGGRTIQVGMPAKQAQRLGITVDPDKPPTEAEIYTPKLMPGLMLLGRSRSISEAAAAIFWLCSPLSNYVTGQVIPVNGRRTRRHELTACPTIQADRHTDTQRHSGVLMPSTPPAYPHVVLRTFASFRVVKFDISPGQHDFCNGFDSRQLH
jgi:hypothetical protein